MAEYKITELEISQNNVKSAADKLEGSPEENKNVFDKLPELIAAKLNAFVDYVFDRIYTKETVDEMVGVKSDAEDVYTKEFIYTKEETDRRINEAVFDSGSADMQKAVYDSDNDGVVEYADTAVKAENAEKLEGHTADYFATAEAVQTVKSTADTAIENAQAAQTTADGAMPKSGGTFTGAVTLAVAPTADAHAATKAYADGKMSKSGGTFTGGVVASNTNRSGYYVRNFWVGNASSSVVSTGYIWATRK